MELIRKSPATLVIKVIIAELLVEFVYLILSLGLSLVSDNLSMQYESARLLLSLVFIVVAISVLSYIVAQWSNEGFIIEKDDLAVKKGIFSSTTQTYPFANMQSVSVRQSMLGKLFNFGNVVIFIPTIGKEVGFYEISDPYNFAEIIKKNIPYPEKNQYIVSNRK